MGGRAGGFPDADRADPGGCTNGSGGRIGRTLTSESRAVSPGWVQAALAHRETICESVDPVSIRIQRMSDKVTNQLLLEHLKAIQSKLSAMANDVGDLKSDMRGLKSHMAGFMQSEVAQDSVIATMQTRLERIERRLELRD